MPIILLAALHVRQTGCMFISLAMGFTTLAMGQAFAVLRQTNDWRARWLGLLGLALFVTQGYWLHFLATTVEVPAAEVPLPTPESPDVHQAPR